MIPPSQTPAGAQLPATRGDGSIRSCRLATGVRGQQCRDGVEQLVDGEGFGHEGVGPDRGDRLFGVRMGRDHDDRDVAGIGLTFQFAANGAPILAGEENVKHDQVWQPTIAVL